jgi:serine/threonine protein kinase/Tfp pilus assembly protein PilF
MSLTAGTKLGPYEIISAIGAGGMGEVYRAHDPKLARDIAIKVLPAWRADPSHVERFRREARAVAALTHPNIVTIHSVEEAGGVHFLTMELVEGQSLAGDIPPGGLALDRFLAIAIALTDALAAAHDRGIVHRDLKPANVMIDRSGRVKVLDFGLAKDLSAEPMAVDETRLNLTREGTVVGTMPYMSPEQIEGKGIDARSDLFSLGVVLYELASGTRPFVGDSSGGVMASILRDVPRPIADRRPEWPDQLGRVIARCLEKHPNDRIQTARDVHNELKALRRESGTTVLSSPAPSAAPKPIGERLVSSAARTAGLWIAVLPFTHRGEDSDLAALAGGLTEDITGGLSRFPHLRVIARQSAAQFAGHTIDVRSVGQQLGTRYVLEGSVRKAGSEVRVTVNLIDTDTGAHLWAEKYDRDVTSTSIFAVQDVLSDRVVATVGDTTGFLVRSMASGLRERPIGDLSFSELKLRHYLYLQQIRMDEHERLRAAFEQALARDPDHADGWAALAYLYMDEHMHHANQLPHALERQHQAARRAVDIDPSGQLGWAALAAAYFFARDLDAFRPAAERAIALNPLHTNTTALMGTLMAYAGDWDHGLEIVRRAMTLNPHHPGWYHMVIFNAHCRLGEYEEAMQRVKRVNIPEWHWTHLATAVVCGHLGRHSEAQAALDILRMFNPAFGLTVAREDWEHWIREPALVERLMDGLRKAGLTDPSPASSPSTQNAG